MSANQYHFVVVYDEKSDTFNLDYDTQEEKFENLSIYNTELDSWQPLESRHFEDDNTPYNRAGDSLALALENLKALPQLAAKECPNHQGGFDCTPFCPLCEGSQEIREANKWA
jgi:hypothetical protein